MRPRSSGLLLPCAALIVLLHPTEAQSTSQHVPSTSEVELVATIAALDSAMFCAFNAHDADRLGTWFTPDLEFYHDKTGLAGYDSTMANFRGLFTRNADTGLHREMVPGSLEVYPLGDFGLLEVCQHRFCHTENGKEDCGTFKNIMVWRRDSTGYKVCRVISYDH
ncbi:MAG: nuclear transport factor 2 family protein [Flavobacteriales bacterium]|jgi:ketosteroid isomerase-like protein|nr:nuclear transport factor 2 family protein [Flavobacteriales bacterium]